MIYVSIVWQGKRTKEIYIYAYMCVYMFIYIYHFELLMEQFFMRLFISVNIETTKFRSFSLQCNTSIEVKLGYLYI